MDHWQEDLLGSVGSAATAEGVLDALAQAARALEFDYCAYGLCIPWPLSGQRHEMLNNYPAAWCARYQEMNYLAQDPSVQHARRSSLPAVWSSRMFATAPALWYEAQANGLRVGWLQSTCDRRNISGMLTFARSSTALTESELHAKELKLRWVVQIAHQTFVRLLAPRLEPCITVALTDREVEVLKWTADGKTTGEISDILTISDNTVNFHVKNAMQKLQASNKTAAAVRAAMMGLLN